MIISVYYFDNSNKIIIMNIFILGAPAIIVGLSVGVRADQYGNYFL